MSQAQKVIKYLATAFAIFLIVTIFSGILSCIYGLTIIFGTEKTSDMQDINLENTSTYLDVDLKYTNLTIEEGEYFLAKTNNSNIECKQDGNKLKIVEKNNSWFKHKNEDIIVYIPKDLKFDYVGISSKAGSITIKNLITDNLKLNLGAGETKIENINSNKTKIDSGVGSFTVDNSVLEDLDFDMGIGEAKIEAKILGNSKIDTGIGSLKLKLIGNKEEYKLKINKGIGDIKVDNTKITAEEIIGDGSNFIHVDGGIGEIKISYEN